MTHHLRSARRDILRSAALLGAAGAAGFAAKPAQAASGLEEAHALLATAARGTGREAFTPASAVRFEPRQNVFLRSALAVDLTYGKASVTLPLFRGIGPGRQVVHYIVTEASDFDVAHALGVNYAPKMRHAAGTPGAQLVTIENGTMHFRGTVDFSPEYKVAPGVASPFPPSVAKPGAVADAEWSSMCVTPAGVVLNAQMVHNASGEHDRLLAADLRAQTATLSLLDGFQDGKQFFYHLVTDVSAEVPSVLEKGVFAPRLAGVPAVGQSDVAARSALLGFSPVVNGIVDRASGKYQGFAASLANGGIDPINIFPIGPLNDSRAAGNNYSPLWDAHVSQWTAAAISTSRVRRITSLDDLRRLVEAGDVTSAEINPPGPGNPFVAGLRPTGAIINCPVIAHPAA